MTEDIVYLFYFPKINQENLYRHSQNNSRYGQAMNNRGRKKFPKKSLSQNYLIDQNICRNIAEAFIINEDDIILEIGAGRGEITKEIIKKNKNIIAVEFDSNNAEILREKFGEIKIINEDILTIDFGKLIPRNLNRKIRIIGNIPYNITSKILFKLIDNRNMISDALLMMQEEVAKRLCARPGTKDYGITSVFTQVFSKPKLLFKVSRNCFYPKPKVDSRMIKLDFSNNLEDEIKNIKFFMTFVRTAFGKRRKTLSNALKDMEVETKKLNLDFNFSRRAESLSVDEFIELSNEINHRFERIKLINRIKTPIQG